jgi:hypothetical protein
MRLRWRRSALPQRRGATSGGSVGRDHLILGRDTSAQSCDVTALSLARQVRDLRKSFLDLSSENQRLRELVGQVGPRGTPFHRRPVPPPLPSFSLPSRSPASSSLSSACRGWIHVSRFAPSPPSCSVVCCRMLKERGLREQESRGSHQVTGSGRESKTWFQRGGQSHPDVLQAVRSDRDGWGAEEERAKMSRAALVRRPEAGGDGTSRMA